MLRCAGKPPRLEKPKTKERGASVQCLRNPSMYKRERVRRSARDLFRCNRVPGSPGSWVYIYFGVDVAAFFGFSIMSVLCLPMRMAHCANPRQSCPINYSIPTWSDRRLRQCGRPVRANILLVATRAPFLLIQPDQTVCQSMVVRSAYGASRADTNHANLT